MTPSSCPRVGCAVRVFMILFALIFARTAYGEVHIARGKVPVQLFAIEGGSIELRGGLFVFAELKFPGVMRKGFGLPENLSRSFLLIVTNTSTSTVWAEVELRVPGTGEVLKNVEKINSGKDGEYKWKLKEVVWDAQYPFTVSVFADKDRTKLLGSYTGSFSFEEKATKQVLEDYNGILWRFPVPSRWAATRATMSHRQDRLLIPGWKDEQAATKGGQSTEEWVEGTGADTTLQADIKRMISTSESAFHPGCDLQVVKQVRSGNNPGIERWSVKSCEGITEYEVRMMPSPRGGTDFKIIRSVKTAKEETAQGAARTPTATQEKSAKKEAKPPFEWDDTYASPGTSLVIKEKGRGRTRQGTSLALEFRATGFANEEGLSLWSKIGADYDELPVTMGREGVVLISGTTTDFMLFTGLVPGQAVDVALFSKATNKRAHAKIIPFPIQAQGAGGCSASAEIRTKTGDLFLITFRGFQANEEVEIVSQHKKERVQKTHTASERGDIGLPVLFGAGDRGKATATATSKNCSVSLQYNVGKDALRSQ